MIPDFKYWLSSSSERAVAVLFDNEHNAYFFDVDVPLATREFPMYSLDKAIYEVALRAFKAESIC